MGRLRLFFTGWGDFFMTIAEALLPSLGLYRLATYVAEKHYAGGLHSPGTKENVLARIHEAAGDQKLAEDCLRRAVAISPDPYEAFLGQFFARTGRPDAAVEAFERARAVSRNPVDLDFIQTRLTELRKVR